METIPGPVDYHRGRDGFGYATSADIYDWVTFVDNSRLIRSEILSKQVEYVDTITEEQKKWLRKQKELKGIKFHETTTDYLYDYSERQILKTRLA